MSDLLTRSRNMSAMLRMCEKISFGSDADVIDELVEYAEQLRLLIGMKNLALEPFAEVADEFDADGRDLPDDCGIYANFAGDFRRARQARDADEVDSDGSAREYLIRKNGYFYRPNRSGYTMEKVAAGRYTKAEAEREAAIEPENFTIMHESEVPDAEEVVDLKAENARLRADLDEALHRYDERNRAAIERAGRSGMYMARLAKLQAEIDRLRPEYQSNSMLDHGRRQMLDYFEKVLNDASR